MESEGALPVVDERSLRPIDDNDTPNDNPAGVPPASVGKPDFNPGDPNGIVIEDGGPGGRIPRSILHASPWDGWPAEWATPAFGRAEALTDTAWAALDLNASVFASMPPYLVGASPTLPDDWLDNPAPDLYNSWADFAHALLWDFQCGEAFVICTARYSGPGGPNTGWPARFHVAPPWTVSVDLVGGGRRVYSIGGQVIPERDVLHIRYQGTVDDAHGHGPLEAGRARLVAANVLLRYLTNFVQGGAIPTSVLETDEDLSATQVTDAQNQWLTARMSSLGLPAMLTGGLKWKATQANALDVALAALAGYTEAKIAVLLGVPPLLLGLPSGGDSMVYRNAEGIYDFHWRGGLRPKAQRLMLALSQWLLPRGTMIEVNRDEYVKPGLLERAQVYDILIRNQVVSPEEVRLVERFDTGSDSSARIPNSVLK